MNREFLLCVLFVATTTGCPSARTMVADVTTDTASIAGALVAAHCGPADGYSQKTDETGRAKIRTYGHIDADACVVVVAKPGYETIERKGARFCRSEEECEPTRYRLRPIGTPSGETR